MYEEHFGLTRRPFAETVDPAAYVALPAHESAVRRLRYGLEHGQGPALLFGPAGAGKTIVARTLARQIGATSHLLAFPALPTAELLAYLAEELTGQASPNDPSMNGALRRIKQKLSASAVRGERPLLIVDESHLISDAATFEALRALLNFATLGPADLMLLLVGGPEIVLQLPPALADRLTARCLLGPLSEDETHHYVNGRLAAAGATEPLFTPDATAALHRAADGLPRRVNRLADLALLIAYAESRPRPDARSVALAVRDFDIDALAA